MGISFTMICPSLPSTEQMLTKYLWLLSEVTKVLVKAQAPPCCMSLDKSYQFSRLKFSHL